MQNSNHNVYLNALSRINNLRNVFAACSDQQFLVSTPAEGPKGATFIIVYFKLQRILNFFFSLFSKLIYRLQDRITLSHYNFVAPVLELNQLDTFSRC